MPPGAADPFDLARFLAAQERDYGIALAELRAGDKRSHWMWYVFPQLRGLGHSSTAVKFGISGIEEARAYLAHPLLGERLRECVRTLLALRTTHAEEVLGHVDAMKLRSCLTLFDAAARGEPLFSRALAQYFHAEPDARTVELLRSPARTPAPG